MNDLRTILAQLKQRWANQSAASRLLVALLVAGLVAGGVVWAVGAGKPNMSLLYSNLGPDDAARIVERLRSQHVPYEIGGGGGEIYVASAQRDEARLTLAGEGLPGGGGVGFEIFDEQQFGESEFAEQVKYHRALEGELARTISNISGVESARVHLVLPQRTLFASSEAPASASVVLTLRPGVRLRDDQVRGVVHLVAASVRSLDPEHVTIVDGSGRPLSGGGDDEEQSTDALAFRRELERSKETALQELLDRTLGANVAAVRVAADVSFSREERTEEQFDAEHPVERSHQTSEERVPGSETATPSGIPGAASNLPGGATPPAGGSATLAAAGLIKRSETRNFEVSKIVRQTVEPVGRLQRLTVAVVVDGNWSGKGARRRFRARPADELARIKSIVESAVGAQATRGDVVTVECVAFAAPPRPTDPGPGTTATPDPFQTYGRFLPWAAGAAVAFMVFVLMLVAMRGGKGARGGAGMAALPGGAAFPALGAAGGAPTLDGAVRPDLLEQARAITGSRTMASDLAAKDPELAARVVRGWLTEPTT